MRLDLTMFDEVCIHLTLIFFTQLTLIASSLIVHFTQLWFI